MMADSLPPPPTIDIIEELATFQSLPTSLPTDGERKKAREISVEATGNPPKRPMDPRHGNAGGWGVQSISYGAIGDYIAFPALG
jgi:hypothetical protein